MHDKPGVKSFPLPDDAASVDAFLTAKLTDGWTVVGIYTIHGQQYVALAQGY